MNIFTCIYKFLIEIFNDYETISISIKGNTKLQLTEKEFNIII